MNIKLFILLSLLLTSFISLSQEVPEIEYEDHYKETIFGINLNTNGGLIGGFNFKISKIKKEKQYETFGFEIVGVKHPKEQRFTNVNTGNSFILAKRNYLFSFRPQYGRDFILFRKAPEEGVQITAVFAAGPSIGLQVPYHILYNFESPIGLQSEQYDPDVHIEGNRIQGVAGIFDGIGGTKVLLGINAKAGINLSFWAFRNSISGLEAGFTFEAFTEETEILAFAQNRSIFTAAYLTLFFGSRK